MIRRDGEKVYFTSVDGVTYRLYDVQAFPSGVRRARNAPSRSADVRVFVREDGTRREAGIGFTERGSLDEDVIDRQLARSYPVERQRR